MRRCPSAPVRPLGDVRAPAGSFFGEEPFFAAVVVLLSVVCEKKMMLVCVSVCGVCVFVCLCVRVFLFLRTQEPRLARELAGAQRHRLTLTLTLTLTFTHTLTHTLTLTIIFRYRNTNRNRYRYRLTIRFFQQRKKTLRFFQHGKETPTSPKTTGNAVFHRSPQCKSVEMLKTSVENCEKNLLVFSTKDGDVERTIWFFQQGDGGMLKKGKGTAAIFFKEGCGQTSANMV